MITIAPGGAVASSHPGEKSALVFDGEVSLMVAQETNPEVLEQLHREVARRRTFAIISHPDAGKTTLTEKLLLYTVPWNWLVLCVPVETSATPPPTGGPWSRSGASPSPPVAWR
jgi:hypothetical protein